MTVVLICVFVLVKRMAVVKLAKSGKSLLFIDDFGNAFITSKVFMQGLLDGKSKMPFMLLKRLPNPINVDRFMKSPVLEFDASGKVVSEKIVKDSNRGPVGDTKASKDGLSSHSTKKNEESKIYSTDIEI